MWGVGILLLCGLATWQGVELVRHSDLWVFRELRRLSGLAELCSPVQRVLLTPLRAVQCGWCCSIWVGGLMAGLCLVGVALGPPWGLVWISVPLALAGSRLANLGNDLTHQWSRTPKPVQHDLDRFTTEQLEQELYSRLGPELYGAREPGRPGGAQAQEHGSPG